jgi:flagellar basal-body rod protein FlgC
MSFDTFNVAQSGMDLSDTWMSAIANNIANVSTVNPAGQAPFRATYLVAQQVQGSTPGGIGQGVELAGLVQDQSAPAMVPDPSSPLANANGDVTEPVVDLSVEMTNMIMAQRSFQANEQTVQTAQTIYQAALQIGK